MFKVKEFEKDDIDGVIAFERELRKQEPDTYYWEPDAAYRKQLEQSFDDERFRTALSFIAVKEEKVIGRIDASLHQQQKRCVLLQRIYGLDLCTEKRKAS